jgi:hypothetical protein
MPIYERSKACRIGNFMKIEIQKRAIKTPRPTERLFFPRLNRSAAYEFYRT